MRIPRHVLATLSVAFATGISLALASVLGWRIVFVVGAFALASWCLVLLDRPQSGLPAALQWLFPAQGKWGRILLIGAAVWILFTFPVWVDWLIR